MFFFHSDPEKKKKKKSKKEIVQERNKKHNQINLLADAQEREAESLQELGGVHLDSNKNMANTLDEKRRQEMLAKLAARKTKLANSKSAAQKRWSVAATSSGSFISR